MPVIDAHVHTGFYMNINYHDDQLLELIRRHGINFCLCASYSAGTIGQATGTVEVGMLADQHPERIGGLVWVVPFDPNWEQDTTQALYAGFYGIFLNPAVDCYRIETNLLRPVFQFAHDHAWPILIKLNEQHAQPAQLTTLTGEFPDVPLVLCDLQGFDELSMVARYENVTVATGNAAAESVKLAVRAVGADRVLWGSGAPIGYFEPVEPVQPATRRSKRNLTLVASAEPPAQPANDPVAHAVERYARLVRAILDLDLPEADLESIFYVNARRVFGLDQLQI